MVERIQPAKESTAQEIKTKLDLANTKIDNMQVAVDNTVVNATYGYELINYSRSWTPPAGVKRVWVTIVGASGGGGGGGGGASGGTGAVSNQSTQMTSGSGGGSGSSGVHGGSGTVIVRLPVTLTDSNPVVCTIGVAGAGGAGGAGGTGATGVTLTTINPYNIPGNKGNVGLVGGAGGAGGVTSFGSYVTITGGHGGQGGNPGNPGNRGVINISGNQPGGTGGALKANVNPDVTVSIGGPTSVTFKVAGGTITPLGIMGIIRNQVVNGVAGIEGQPAGSYTSSWPVIAGGAATSNSPAPYYTLTSSHNPLFSLLEFHKKSMLSYDPYSLTGGTGGYGGAGSAGTAAVVGTSPRSADSQPGSKGGNGTQGNSGKILIEWGLE